MSIIKATIQLRRDNDYNFDKIKDTFIPANGEVVLVDTARDGLRAKVGNGFNSYAELNFTDEDVRNAVLHGYFIDGSFYKTLNKDGLIAPMIIKSILMILQEKFISLMVLDINHFKQHLLQLQIQNQA